MSTVTRSELSEKNEYYVEKHRFLELKHFCLQYPIWKEAYCSLDGLSKRPTDLLIFSKTVESPTEKCAIAKQYYLERMTMIENACYQTDKELCSYILHAVTEERSYESLLQKYSIPCCREYYYKLYRKFFYILSKLRE